MSGCESKPRDETCIAFDLIAFIVIMVSHRVRATTIEGHEPITSLPDSPELWIN